MRENEFRIDEQLRNGLRADKRNPIGSVALTECMGFRCGQFGLEAFERLESAIDVMPDIKYEWPYPQFIFQDKFRILISQDTFHRKYHIYVFNDTYTAYTHTEYEWDTYGEGVPFEAADFGGYMVLVNGKVTLYYEPVGGTWVIGPSTSTFPIMQTICNFKGQLVGGYVLSDWHDCDESFIVWSKIGSADFTPDLRNEAGFRRDLFGGYVLNVKRLGDAVMVYSCKGITKMTPVIEPAATFAFRDIMPIGIRNRGAIAGDMRKHVFVGSDNAVWEVSGESVKRLGYEEFMDRLGDSKIYIHHDAIQDDYYITNGEETYMLSPYGMSEVPHHVTAIWNDRGSYALPDEADICTPTIVTDSFDFGMRGQKTIFTLEAGIDDVVNPTMAVDYKFKQSDLFRRSDWVRLNNEAVASKLVAGTDFRLCFRCEYISEKSKIDYLIARYKMTDLRSIRGIYAAPPRGQRYDQ